MMDIDWSQDDRSTDAAKYLVDINLDFESRRRAFLGGWTRYLSESGGHSETRVTWEKLGMVYASVLGDIPVEQRKQLYSLALGQYVCSQRAAHWTDRQRRDAMRLATELWT